MRVRKWPVVGLLLALLWLFVRGVEFAPDRFLAELLIGLAVGLPLAFAFRRMYLPTVDLGRSLIVLPTATYYVAVFLWEVLTANVDVAYRVLHPSMPIEPDVVELPLRVETDAAVTTIANSITLTPGTLTMDHVEDTNTLYVHGIVGRRRERVVAPIRRWEDLLLVVFDEDADPEDDPPRPGERERVRAADAGSSDDATTEPGGSQSATSGLGDPERASDASAETSSPETAGPPDDGEAGEPAGGGEAGEAADGDGAGEAAGGPETSESAEGGDGGDS